MYNALPFADGCCNSWTTIRKLNSLFRLSVDCFSAFTYRRYSMAHTALQVADKFIRLGLKSGKYFTQMQLLKLVYIAHGWTLATTDQPLIHNQVEAWQYGPVIPDLYHELKYNGAKPIERPILSDEASFSSFENQVIDFTFKNYGNFSAFQLSDITHAPNTPWSETFGRLDYIPDNLIANHYKELYQKYSAKAG